MTNCLFISLENELVFTWRVPVNVSVLRQSPASLLDVPKSEILTTPLKIKTMISLNEIKREKEKGYFTCKC